MCEPGSCTNASWAPEESCFTSSSRLPLPQRSYGSRDSSYPAPVLRRSGISVGPPSDGEQLVLVFVGSTSCIWSGTPEVRHAVDSAVGLLGEYAQQRGMAFHRIGIVASPSPESGLAFLDRFGEFDEIIVGGWWSNAGLRKYVMSDFRGSGVTPQLLVLQRRIGDNGRAVSDEQLLRRLVGSAMITTRVSGQGGLLPSG